MDRLKIHWNTYDNILLDLLPRLVLVVRGDRHSGDDHTGVLLNQIIIGGVGCRERRSISKQVWSFESLLTLGGQAIQ